jgi:hypothetical protein
MDLALTILLSVAFALVANWAMPRLGALGFLAAAFMIALIVAVAAHFYPLIPTHFLEGRAFAFFRTRYLAYSIATVGLAVAAISLTRASVPMRVTVGTIAGFLVAWGGSFIT